LTTSKPFMLLQRFVNYQRGYVTLLAALIVIAAGGMLVEALLLWGGNRAQSARVMQQSFEARTYANACAEEALLAIIEEGSSSGSDSFVQGECAYEISGAELERDIESTGTSGSVVRRVHVVAQIEITVGEMGTSTTITSAIWREVADF